MVRVRYTGLINPKASFDELRPFREALIRMGGSYFPFGPDYLVLREVTQALDRAATHFTGDPEFYWLKSPRSRSNEPGSWG